MTMNLRTKTIVAHPKIQTSRGQAAREISIKPMSCMPSAGSSEDGVPAPGDTAVWKRRMDRQRQRRLGADELWSSLDDVVHDESEFS